MNVEDAQIYSEELELLRFYPANENARVVIQKIIAQVCHDSREARRLVDEMALRFNEWPGPQMLRQIHDELFGKHEADETWKGYEPVTLECEDCRDFGWRKERDGRHLRCHCDRAHEVTDEELERLDRIYRPKPQTRRKCVIEPITAEEAQALLARAMESRRVQ